MHSIFLFHSYRVGSNVLGSILANNGLGEPQEYFNSAWQKSLAKLRTKKARNLLAERTFERRSKGGIFSCKFPMQDLFSLLLALDISYDSFWQVREITKTMDYLYLTRSDLFLQSISFWRAQKSNEWFRYHRDFGKPVPNPPYNFNEIYECYIYLTREEHLWNEFFKANQLAPTRLCYEDFQADLNSLKSTVQLLLDNAAEARETPRRLGPRSILETCRSATRQAMRRGTDLLPILSRALPPKYLH